MTTDNGEKKDAPANPRENPSGPAVERQARLDAQKQEASQEFRTDLPSQRRVEQKLQPERVASRDDDAGQAEVAEKMNEDLAKGYHGDVPDDTPNENYTVDGVIHGAPRPDAQEEPMSPGEAEGKTE